MKKIHIVILILIAAAISLLISSMGNLSSYESIASARKNPGKFVNLIVKLDKTKPIEHDALKNPNFLSFHVVDSVGNETKAVIYKEMPPEFSHSERLVLKGRMKDSVFVCDDILLKCPSKYKDDPKKVQESLNQNTQQ